ncbi:MAG TPA: coproporphyrinogen III oxidase, partial [Candidatus Avirikenella pullistercoris]|nr:coproporphyrinogen III oxidase [Candidatus Avirikenella pullistercoris]
MDKAGFIHYEVSNFASGERFMALHNTNYWKGIPYLGAGPSAHSYNLVSRQWNVASNKLYLESLYGGGSFYEKEELSLQDRYNEYVMTALRTMWGADTDTVRERFSPAMADYLEKQAAPFVKQGMLVSGGSRLYIPSGQFLISDYIISHLFI